MTTDPSTVALYASMPWQPPRKRFSSLLKKRAHAEVAKQCGERSDSAIRSRSQGAQQQNTRPR
jgi:hypothetical protein